MADNYLENRHDDWLKLKAKKEAKRKARLRKAREQYVKKLNDKQQEAHGTQPPQQ